MNTRSTRTLLIAAATTAVLAIGAAAPASILAAGPPGGSARSSGPRTAAGAVVRADVAGARGVERRGGAPVTTLTSTQRAQLAFMAEEEKLARDLYLVLGSEVGGSVLPTIARAEARHLAAVRRLLARHGVPDPTAGRALGVFSTPSVQAMYERLLAEGRVSRAAAHEVGTTVERDDLAALSRASAGVTAPDVLRVYEHLRRASERHLLAFEAS
jgi:hypothetical protein